MRTQTYLFFEGRTEEALEFYKKTLGIEVEVMMRFKDAPKEAQAGMTPGLENKVMHSSFKLGEQTVMASDGHCGGTAEFKGFSLSLLVKDAAEAEKVFAALSQGGQVRQPLIQTFFSPKFGVLQDKFGVSWMVLVSQG